MVQLDSVRRHNTRLVQSRPLVAVFSGATSGIGMSTLLTLAKTHSTTTGKGLRVYLIGRSKEKTAAVIAQCRSLCPVGDFRFLHTNDLSLLSEVDRVCEDIVRQETAAAAAAMTKTTTKPTPTLTQAHTMEDSPPKIDLVVMTQGELSFQARTETVEGLEFRVSLLYYSRIKMIVNLLPLLTGSGSGSRTSNGGSAAHIISVFAAGQEGELYLDDISLRDPRHWGIGGTRSHVTYMTTFMFEHLASQYPGKLSLVHVFPGLILTDGFQKMPAWFRFVFGALTPILRFFVTSLDECGERVLFLASQARFPPKGTSVDRADGAVTDEVHVAVGTDLTVGSGAYGVSLDAEVTPEARMRKTYDQLRADGAGDVLVAHTEKVFAEIKAGRRFKD